MNLRKPSYLAVPSSDLLLNLRLDLGRALGSSVLALATGALLPTHAARADDAAPGTGELAPVTVTAERRTENIKDVPISISTLGGDALDAVTAGGEDVRMLSARLPSLNIESSFGRAFPRFYVRGYGNSDFHLNASQPVSLIYDDVVQENPILKGFPVFDLDEVELIRGPQGTLFGRNTPAGVVKFNSAAPSFKPGGYLYLSNGTYDTGNLEGAFNMPLNDEWAARLSVLYQHRDDWMSNSYTNDNSALGGYDDGAARFQLLFKPSKTFSALANVHIRELNGTAQIFRANIIQQGTNSLVPDFSPGSVAQDGLNQQVLHNYGASLRLQWNLAGMALHSITGYETVGAFSRGDIDGGYGASYAPPYGPGFIPFSDETSDSLPKHKQFTQEVRLESNTKGPLSWQTGVYYFYEGYRIDSYTYDSLGGGEPTSLEQSRQQNNAYAVFGSASYAITPQFSVRGGLRYTDDTKNFATEKYENITFPTGTELTANPHASKVNWDVSPTYAVNKNVNVYARVATGFRAPSIQPASAFNVQSVANSETVLSYEIGTKADFWHKRARVAFDLFQYDVKDQQLTAVGGQANGATLINAAKTVGRGAELDLQLRPIDNMLATLSGSYNFTEIKDPNLYVYPCGSVTGCTVLDPAGPATGPTAGTVSIDGNPLPQAPKLVGDFSLRYGIPTAGGGEYFAYTDWSYRSSVDFFLYQSVEYTGKPLLNGGLRAGYDWQNGKYEVAAFSRNITNRIVTVGGLDFNNLTGFINEPRVFGMQFKATF